MRTILRMSFREEGETHWDLEWAWLLYGQSNVVESATNRGIETDSSHFLPHRVTPFTSPIKLSFHCNSGRPGNPRCHRCPWLPLWQRFSHITAAYHLRSTESSQNEACALVVRAGEIKWSQPLLTVMAYGWTVVQVSDKSYQAFHWLSWLAQG